MPCREEEYCVEIDFTPMEEYSSSPKNKNQEWSRKTLVDQGLRGAYKLMIKPPNLDIVIYQQNRNPMLQNTENVFSRP